MQKQGLELAVGSFVLLGLAALVFLSLKVGNLAGGLSGAGSYELVAYFDNIGGLKEKAPIKSAGVVVGRVQQITFDSQRFQGRVVLSMNDAYSFPKDSSAKILTAGLLGEQYIGLEPGFEENVLKGGDKVSMTQSAVVLENLISQFLYSQAAKAGE